MNKRTGRCSGLPLFVLLTLLTLMSFSGISIGHELWLKPSSYRPSTIEPVVVTVRNGRNFVGDVLPYVPEYFSDYSLSHGNTTRAIEASIGEWSPVLPLAGGTGLNIVRYQSVINRLEYTEFTKFSQFAQEEGIDWVLQKHQDRFGQELPVREIYRRYAKSLVQVGEASEGAGNDKPTGMELELVAIDGPCTVGGNATLRIQLLYQGSPLADAQVTVYTRDANEPANRSLAITDHRGFVDIPCLENHEYLVNAVHIRPAGLLERLLHGTHWESLWASLTFEIS